MPGWRETASPRTGRTAEGLGGRILVRPYGSVTSPYQPLKTIVVP